MTESNDRANFDRRGPLRAGEAVILYDRRKRRYQITLQPGASFYSHLGSILHDNLIGSEEGFHAVTNRGHRMLVLRPSFSEAVLDLPRQSQVIYPKDLAAILMHANVFPGARVAELGLGSGAMSAAILRAIGPDGSLTTYEVRPEIVAASKANVAELAPGATNHTIVVADAYAHGIAERGLDVVIADLPEPWRMAEAAASALRPGGTFLGYLPTVLQVHQFVMALTKDPSWRLVETVEVLERPWHVTDLSVRPEHRMVAHTGFITTARRCLPPPAAEARPPAEVKAD